MNGYLLDTHVLLWWLDDPALLSQDAQSVIDEADNRVIASIASVWEIAIKATLGKLEAPEDLEEQYRRVKQAQSERRRPMRIRLRDPLQELAEFERTVDRMLGRGRQRVSYGYPPIDLMDTGGAFVLSARLPGVAADQIRLSVSGVTVTLEGQRKPVLIEDAKPILRERLYGQFRKSIDLPEPVHEEEVEARYIDGILQVPCPKRRLLQPKTISVQ